MARLKTKYKDTVVPAMIKEFAYTNPMQVPKLNKITINVGLGEATQNAKAMDSAVTDITAITGQKPVVTKLKKAIANFKLRENIPIGCMVTLRRDRMYEFLDRLIHTALPRVRDFKACRTNRSTVVATTLWACVNRLFSRRFKPIKSTNPEA